MAVLSEAFGLGERTSTNLAERLPLGTKSVGILDVAGVSDDTRRYLLQLAFALGDTSTTLDSKQLFLIGPAGVEKTTLGEALLNTVKENPKSRVKIIDATQGQYATYSYDFLLHEVIEEAKTARNKGQRVVLWLDEAQKNHIAGLDNKPGSIGTALSNWSALLRRDNVFVLGTATARDIQELGKQSAFWSRMHMLEIKSPRRAEVADLIAHYVVTKNDKNDQDDQNVWDEEFYNFCATYINANADYWDWVTGNLYDTQSPDYEDLDSKRKIALNNLLLYLDPVIDVIYDEAGDFSYLSQREIVEYGMHPLTTEFTIRRRYEASSAQDGSSRRRSATSLTVANLGDRLRERVLQNRMQAQVA